MFEPAATLHLSLNYCSNCCRSAEQRLQILSLSLDKNIWIQFCSNHRLSYTVQSIHSQCIEAEIWVHFKIDWSIQMFSQNSFNHWFLFSTKKSGWVREQLERERGDAELSWASLLPKNENFSLNCTTRLNYLQRIETWLPEALSAWIPWTSFPWTRKPNFSNLSKGIREATKSIFGKFYVESSYDETALSFVENMHFDFSQAFRCQSMWKNPLLCIWIFEWAAATSLFD